MRIGENPAVDVWMADVSHYVFKMFSEGKDYEQWKFSGERFIILYLCKFGRLLGVDHSTLSFYWNFWFRLLKFNPKFYLNFPIVVTIIYFIDFFSLGIGFVNLDTITHLAQKFKNLYETRVPFNFQIYSKWIIECKNWRVQIQLNFKLDFNWSPIFTHVHVHLSFKFLCLWELNLKSL